MIWRNNEIVINEMNALDLYFENVIAEREVLIDTYKKALKSRKEDFAEEEEEEWW